MQTSNSAAMQNTTATKQSNASKKAIADVWKACADISGADPNSQPDSDMSLFDMGLDSLGLAELVIQLEEVYGEGSLTVDDILAAPTLREVASCLPGAAGAPAAPAPVKAAPVKAAPSVVVAPAAKPTPRHPSSSTPKNAPPPMYKSATPANKPTPSAPKPTPVAATPRTPANGAAQAIIERLAKLENESRELRSLVGSLAIGGTPAPVPMAPMSSAVPETETEDIQAQMCYEEPAPSMEDQWIRTTHVGSLPRAAKGQSSDIMEIVRMQLASGLDVINDGEWSRDNYVRQQLSSLSLPHPAQPTPCPASCLTTQACLLTPPSRYSQIADLLSRIDGLGSADGKAGAVPGPGCMCEMPLATDMGDVPTYAQRFTGGNGLITLNPARVAKARTSAPLPPRQRLSALKPKQLASFPLRRLL